MLNKHNSNSRIVKKVFKQTLIVQILTMLIGVLGMVIDGVVTGSLLSTSHMAAYGIVMPLLTIFSAIATIFEVGISTLLGRVLGSGDSNKASSVLSTCLITAFVSSIVVWAITCFGREILVPLFGKTTDSFVFEQACDFLLGFSFIAPGMFILMSLFPVMQLNGDSKRLVVSILVMTSINIILDFTNGLVLHLGLLGMSLATTISYYCALVVMIPHFLKKGNIIKLTFKNLKLSYAWKMLTYGLPNTIQQVCKSMLVICINQLILQIANSDYVAVYASINSAANMCMVLGSALGTTSLIVGSVFDGEKDLASIKKLMKMCFVWALILDVLLSTIMIIFADLIMPGFLSKDGNTEILQILIFGFRLYALSITFYAINCILRMYFLVVKKIGLSYLFAALNNFAFPCASAFMLTYLFGINGVWLSYLCGEALTIIMYLIYVLIVPARQRSLVERFLLIPTDYNKGLIAEYVISISKKNEISVLKDEVENFCIANKGSQQIANTIKLICEELTYNILIHSFNDNKQHYADIKLIRKHGSWTLRIRDDSFAFNPLDYLKETGFFDNKKSEFNSHTGLKLVYKLSANMEYLNTLSINNLIVDIK